MRVVALDLAGMVAGNEYRGEFEQRLTGVIDEIVAARPRDGFVDELHAVVGAGARGRPMDAGTMLKPALARGELQLLGATTFGEYRRHIERDPALERRFDPVHVAEPPSSRPWRSCAGCGALEAHHAVGSRRGAGPAAELSDRYLSDRFLPDKAIDLVDRAAARAGRARGGERRRARSRFEQLRRARDVAVDAEDYERAGADRASWRRARRGRRRVTPSRRITADDVAALVAHRYPGGAAGRRGRDRLLDLEDLLPRAVGQDEAVEAVADAVRAGRAGLPTPDGRSVRCCSWARPGSARPSWPARWPRPVRLPDGRCAST